MTNQETDFVKNCVTNNRVHDFYIWGKWRHKRREILERDHYECQECKRRGKYSRAVIVHHVKHLRHRPDLALSNTYTDEHGNEQRQLISVCKECHETVCHPERLHTNQPQKPQSYITEERWD